jgi:DNA-directed RNA polymerase subunit RPC12/RpoP
MRADLRPLRPELYSLTPIFLLSVRTHLRCVDCAEEFFGTADALLDSTATCPKCGSHAEIRQLHEAWCGAHRFILARAFPEIDFSEGTVALGREGLAR